MRPDCLLSLTILAMATAVPLAVHASTEVTFDHPERFNDAGRFGGDSAKNVQVLADELTRLGERLPPDADLKIEITDVRLAGQSRFFNTANPDLRVLNGRADWPSVRMRYTLTVDGKSAGPVDEMVEDQNYLDSIPPSDPSQRLPYERRMLARWFEQRFVRHEPAPQQP